MTRRRDSLSDLDEALAKEPLKNGGEKLRERTSFGFDRSNSALGVGAKMKTLTEKSEVYVRQYSGMWQSRLKQKKVSRDKKVRIYQVNPLIEQLYECHWHEMQLHKEQRRLIEQKKVRALLLFGVVGC